MTSRLTRMEELLRAALHPTQLDIIDNSAQHHGHAGARPEGETHFTIKIESEAFRELGRIAQHQLVYQALAHELQNGLHAVSIITLLPSKHG